jgi:hypothetical protein
MNACDPQGRPPILARKTVGKMGLQKVVGMLNIEQKPSRRIN